MNTLLYNNLTALCTITGFHPILKILDAVNGIPFMKTFIASILYIMGDESNLYRYYGSSYCGFLSYLMVIIVPFIWLTMAVIMLMIISVIFKIFSVLFSAVIPLIAYALGFVCRPIIKILAFVFKPAMPYIKEYRLAIKRKYNKNSEALTKTVGNAFEDAVGKQIQKRFNVEPHHSVITFYQRDIDEMIARASESDFVFVTPKGIFVTECKYRGTKRRKKNERIILDTMYEDGKIKYNSMKFRKHEFDPVAQNKGHIVSLTKMFNEHIPADLMDKTYSLILTDPGIVLRKFGKEYDTSEHAYVDNDNNIIFATLNSMGDVERAINTLPNTFNEEQIRILNKILWNQSNRELLQQMHAGSRHAYYDSKDNLKNDELVISAIFKLSEMIDKVYDFLFNIWIVYTITDFLTFELGLPDFVEMLYRHPVLYGLISSWACFKGGVKGIVVDFSTKNE